MMTIYADVLVAVNAYTTFFLIKAVTYIMRTEITQRRAVTAALFGGLSALVTLLPPLPDIISILIKCAVCAVTVLIAFGFGHITRYLIHTLFFLLASLVFGGAALMAEQLGADFVRADVGGFAYIDVSFLTLTLSTAAAYLIIAAIRRLCDSRTDADAKYYVIVENNGKSVTLNALCDSGNKLTDIISGLPVIICDYNACRDILPPSLCGSRLPFDYRNSEICNISGLRILPVATVGGEGFIAAFRPKRITVRSIGAGTRCKTVTALIGISSEGLADTAEKAILNPKIMI